MKHIKMKYGFTLIELLVVVIIIAVLSAVAVPMYKHAALKSRFSKVMPVAKSIVEAQEVYYLGKNIYAANDEKDLLDVAPSGATTIELATRDQENQYNYVAASSPEVPGARYIMYQKHSPKFADTIQCEADENNPEAVWLCSKGLNGQLIDGSVNTAQGSYVTYLLSGTKGSGDTLPTSLDKLGANLCGENPNCSYTVNGQMVTTKTCGETQSYDWPNYGTVSGPSCTIQTYNSTSQNPVNSSVEICYAFNTIAHGTYDESGNCVPGGTGFFSYTFDGEGNALMSKTCNKVVDGECTVSKSELKDPSSGKATVQRFCVGLPNADGTCKNNEYATEWANTNSNGVIKYDYGSFVNGQGETINTSFYCKEVNSQNDTCTHYKYYQYTNNDTNQTWWADGCKKDGSCTRVRERGSSTITSCSSWNVATGTCDDE